MLQLGNVPLPDLIYCPYIDLQLSRRIATFVPVNDATRLGAYALSGITRMTYCRLTMLRADRSCPGLPLF